jgi:hypothetical protein
MPVPLSCTWSILATPSPTMIVIWEAPAQYTYCSKTLHDAVYIATTYCVAHSRIHKPGNVRTSINGVIQELLQCIRRSLQHLSSSYPSHNIIMQSDYRRGWRTRRHEHEGIQPECPIAAAVDSRQKAIAVCCAVVRASRRCCLLMG